MTAGDEGPPRVRPGPAAGSGPEEPRQEGAEEPPEIVELEITDILDLHGFPPREMLDVVRTWLDEAYARGLRDLRIIHGRGIGVQRRAVRTLLAGDPRVEALGDEPAEAGGWGATWVRLR